MRINKNKKDKNVYQYINLNKKDLFVFKICDNIGTVHYKGMGTKISERGEIICSLNPFGRNFSHLYYRSCW